MCGWFSIVYKSRGAGVEKDCWGDGMRGRGRAWGVGCGWVKGVVNMDRSSQSAGVKGLT